MNKRLAALLCAALLLAGCQSAARQESSLSFFAMDTYMTVRAYGADEAVLAGVRAQVEEMEGLLSVTLPDSEISRLNRGEAVRLSEPVRLLLEKALSLCAETGGALDISVYPVVKAWGFTTGEYRVPGAEEIAELLKKVDYTGIDLAGDEVRLPEGMEIDLGSVAKGRAGDVIAAALRAAGVESALLDLGGNVQAVGAKPDGSAWRVALQDPLGEGWLGVAQVRDEAVVTSGGYERYFEDEAGNRWWHIMDPATGRPARSGLLSVTVVGPEGAVCDALSTALFVMGADGAVEFWRGRSGFEMALVTEAGELILTPGLAERFAQDADSPYRLRVIDDAED